MSDGTFQLPLGACNLLRPGRHIPCIFFSFTLGVVTVDTSDVSTWKNSIRQSHSFA